VSTLREKNEEEGEGRDESRVSKLDVKMLWIECCTNEFKLN